MMPPANETHSRNLLRAQNAILTLAWQRRHGPKTTWCSVIIGWAKFGIATYRTSSCLQSLEPQKTLSNTLLHMMQKQKAIIDALAAQVKSLNQLVASATSPDPTPPTPTTSNALSEANPIIEQAQHRFGQISSLASILKSSNFSSFHGKESESTSVRVCSFISDIRKVTNLCLNISEAQEVYIAVCLLRDHADLWYARATNDHYLFSNLSALQEAMLSEFVPSSERAMRVALIQLRLSVSLESHMEGFRELVDVCQTPDSEAFKFLQLLLPILFRKKLSERFPDGSPSSILE